MIDFIKNNNIKKFFKGFCIPMILLVPFIGVILGGQNHFSATFLICAVTCIQMFIAGVLLRHFIIAGVLGVVSVFAGLGIKNAIKPPVAGKQNFRFTRIQTWLDPFSDPTGDGWQIIQSLYAIASGSLFGLGFGESRQKYLYLPEPHNDFIFAVAGEELGFVGTVVIILLLLFITIECIFIARKAKDAAGRLICSGMAALIGFQSIVNIGVATGVMPNTGVTLPFVGYGLTSLWSLYIGIGLVLNVGLQPKKY